MQLDENQMKKVQDYLNEKWAEPRECPICHHQDWQPSDVVFEIFEYTGASFPMQARRAAIPLFTMMCGNCAYMALFNAIEIGIIPPHKGDTEGEIGKQR